MDRTGRLNPPSAQGTVIKNKTAVVTQSGAMIPFFRLFQKQAARPGVIAPPASWLNGGIGKR